MTQFSERVAERSVAAVRERATDEVGRLVASGLAVLRRSGVAGLTVNDVLAEAGLSTRAFYRHFASKNELVLAVFEHDSSRSNSRLADAVANAETARAAFEAWLDENLALVFEPRRARRTRTLWLEGSRLRNEFPQEFDAIVAGQLAPLVEVLRRGLADGTFPTARPEGDARSIHAVVWDLVERHLGGAQKLDRDEVRAHVLRFCLPALGAKP
jgi:AcrR family transcriptional regulator